MKSVKNINLKNNFLKHIIIRLDFQKVPLTEITKTLGELKNFFKNNGFNHFEIKKENQARIDLPRSGQESLEIHGSITKVKEIYSFSDDNNGINVDLCDNFIIINVNSNKYIPFLDYFKYLNFVIFSYKKIFPFLVMTRLGIRKQNVCIVEGENNINKYFSKDTLNFYNKLQNINNLSSTKLETFEIEEYRVNLKNSIIKGMFNNRNMYKIILDIDAYLNNDDLIRKVLSNDNVAERMNNIIFDVFISNLTDEFVDMLSEDEFIDNLIIGVESNE